MVLVSITPFPPRRIFVLVAALPAGLLSAGGAGVDRRAVLHWTAPEVPADYVRRISGRVLYHAGFVDHSLSPPHRAADPAVRGSHRSGWNPIARQAAVGRQNQSRCLLTADCAAT